MTESAATGSSEDEKAAYKAKLQSLSFGGVPGGARTEKGVRAAPSPSWERGLTGEHRPDGSFMPYLDGGLNPIRQKQFGEKRHVYEAAIKELRTPTQE